MVLKRQKRIELTKHEIGLKWWSEDVFFLEIKPHLRTLTAVYLILLKSDPHCCFSIPLFSCSEANTDLCYTITCEFFTSRPNATRQFGSKFLKLRERNASLPIPPDCERWSSATYTMPLSAGTPKAVVTQGHSAAVEPTDQSNVSGSERHFSPATPDHLFGPSVATVWSHFNTAWNGQRLHVFLGSEEEEEDAQIMMDAGLSWRQMLYSDTWVSDPWCHPI